MSGAVGHPFQQAAHFQRDASRRSPLGQIVITVTTPHMDSNKTRSIRMNKPTLNTYTIYAGCSRSSLPHVTLEDFAGVDLVWDMHLLEMARWNSLSRCNVLPRQRLSPECVCWSLVYPGCHDYSRTTGVQPHPDPESNQSDSGQVSTHTHTHNSAYSPTSPIQPNYKLDSTGLPYLHKTWPLYRVAIPKIKLKKQPHCLYTSPVSHANPTPPLHPGDRRPTKGKGKAEVPAYHLVPVDTPVTIHHLLTHTSGLKNKGLGSAIASVGRHTKDDTLATYIPKLAKVPLDFQPGTQWAYSQGLDVVARIIEIVSETPFWWVSAGANLPAAGNEQHVFQSAEWHGIETYRIEMLKGPWRRKGKETGL